MYENGALTWDAPCVTGNVSKNYTTPEVEMRKNLSREEREECLGDRKLTRNVLKKYVKGIYVYDDGRVKVEWKE